MSTLNVSSCVNRMATSICESLDNPTPKPCIAQTLPHSHFVEPFTQAFTTWGSTKRHGTWSNTKESLAAGKKSGTPYVTVFKQNGGKVREGETFCLHGTPMTGPDYKSPTPNLPMDIQQKDFAWSRKCKDFNPTYPPLDISHQPGWSTADLSFHSKSYDRGEELMDEIRYPRDYKAFREAGHGATPAPQLFPPVMKQHFSLSNTPTSVVYANEHERVPTGQRAAFWNIKKTQNFSSAQYDIVNPMYPMKDCYKWKYDTARYS